LTIDRQSKSSKQFLTAVPLEIAIIEFGFLDGRKLSDLFLQDILSAESMYTNVKVTYKARHVHGGTLTDYLGAYKSVVA